MQCRITTEDPENNFIPDYGRLTAYRGAAGFGIRLDGGTAYSGAVMTPYYDSLLEKVTAWAPTAEETIARMDRALREFRIRGVATNLSFLENVLDHPRFRDGSYTTRFIDETPELFQFAEPPRPRHPAARLHRRRHRQRPSRSQGPRQAAGHRPRAGAPHFDLHDAAAGHATAPERSRPRRLRQWMLAQKQVLVTDTTLRDAHQSLIATRMRTCDMLSLRPPMRGAAAALLARMLGRRHLRRGDALPARRTRGSACPTCASACPTSCSRCCCAAPMRSATPTIPDNVVRFFVEQAAAGGIDVFRVFDSLNWVENMRVALDAVGETGRLCEGAICYTGDSSTPTAPSTTSITMSISPRSWRRPAHILGIKDMAGSAKPAAARVLVKALKEEIGLPIHFHTHDTSGISAASVLAAVDAGVDAVDAAMDALSGLTSQPSLGSLVAGSRHSERDPDSTAALPRSQLLLGGGARPLRCVRERPAAGASDVYQHEMPGGQYHQPARTGSRARPRHRWPDVCQRLRRRQPFVRRHRQGHADLEGGRRHGADHGVARPHAADVLDPAKESRSRHRCRAVPRRSGPAARRLAGGAVKQALKGEAPIHRVPARFSPATSTPSALRPTN